MEKKKIRRQSRKSIQQFRPRAQQNAQNLTIARRELEAYQYLCQSAAILKWISLVLEIDFFTKDLFEDWNQGKNNVLASLLKDGTILCQLINKIKPGTIQNYHGSRMCQTNKFLSLENIMFFINSSKKFGVDQSILFQPTDLYEEKNMPKVIYTILALANCVLENPEFDFNIEIPSLLGELEFAKPALLKAADELQNFSGGNFIRTKSYKEKKEKENEKEKQKENPKENSKKEEEIEKTPIKEELKKQPQEIESLFQGLNQAFNVVMELVSNSELVTTFSKIREKLRGHLEELFGKGSENRQKYIEKSLNEFRNEMKISEEIESQLTFIFSELADKMIQLRIEIKPENLNLKNLCEKLSQLVNQITQNNIEKPKVEKTLPDRSKESIKFEKHLRVLDSAEFQPNETFTKGWRFRNNGSCDWEEGLTIKWFGGNDLRRNREVVKIPPKKPGETVDVFLKMQAPSEPGRYVGYYRIVFSDDFHFGEQFFVVIHVIEPKKLSEEDTKLFQGLKQLEELGFTDKERNRRLLKQFDYDVTRVTEELLK
eukprot:Anaeramoba_ignava/a91669_87.p1 GENE.a91669_87~~a91669_87.p1  ORF type:complete len:543 (-),score=208.92 a91669_87:58-1686(-)